MAPETLLFQTSPLGNIDAIVQHDDHCVYFFLNENPGSIVGGAAKFGTRSVWVRNLETGPLVINQNDLQNGLPTPLPRSCTVHRQGQRLLQPDEIKVVWFEEGNAAALVRPPVGDTAGEVLAVIPPWSGRDGFHGYANQCAAENEVCWPMPKNPQLKQRIQRAEEFWRSFSDQDQPSPFAEIQTNQLKYYQRRFLDSLATGRSGDAVEQANYFSIDGKKFPPRGLAQYRTSDTIFLLTVGMALLPQPMVELASETPAMLRRVELGIQVPVRQTTDGLLASMRKKMSQLAAYPWSSMTWLGHGHSCSLGDVPIEFGHAALIDDSLVRDRAAPGLPDFRGDRVNLLWLAPINAPAADVNDSVTRESASRLVSQWFHGHDFAGQ